MSDTSSPAAAMQFAQDRALVLGGQADGEHKKSWGQYFTPARLSEYAASLPSLDGLARHVRILDPGAGTGVLGLDLARRVLANDPRASVELVAIEPEPSARRGLEASLHVARSVFGSRLNTQVLSDDILDLAQPRHGAVPLPLIDIVIANPPYFKLSPNDLRGGDAPNIYARFMEISASLLRPDGQLCFIVPRSYASGSYFRRFRRRFHSSMRLDLVHIFQSRRDAFRTDKVLQENIVTLYTKTTPDPEGRVLVASSSGLDDVRATSPISVRRADIAPTSGDALMSLPTTVSEVGLAHSFRHWSNRLADLNLQVSTGPVVPFRAKALLVKSPQRSPTVPLLWLQHVRPGVVEWPLGDQFRKQEHIRVDVKGESLLPNKNYVLIRRFSAKEEKRRLTAAALLADQFETEQIGLENHLNYIHRPGGSMSAPLALGLARLFNTEILDRYFRIFSGNTQVSASELRTVPLPSASFLEQLGRRTSASPETIEQLVEEDLRGKEDR